MDLFVAYPSNQGHSVGEPSKKVGKNWWSWKKNLVEKRWWLCQFNNLSKNNNNINLKISEISELFPYWSEEKVGKLLDLFRYCNMK